MLQQYVYIVNRQYVQVIDLIDQIIIFGGKHLVHESKLDSINAYRPDRGDEVGVGRDIYVVRVSRDALKQLKEQLADECVLLAERVIPGLASMVSHRYISTPLTWHDYTLTPQGSAFGIRKDYRQPLLTMLSPRTPIPNLLLTGQSIHVHGLEGVTMTALQTTDIINKLK